jgi:branched-chain amino acid transport system ATP-binding protein
MDEIVGYFPRLGERLGQRAGSLSGGEQQMLAMGRALMAAPRLLLIDELSLGLMPKVIDDCYDVVARLRQSGLTILLVEQNTERALSVADHVCVLESGRIAWSGSATDARRNEALVQAYLGVSAEVTS